MTTEPNGTPETESRAETNLEDLDTDEIFGIFEMLARAHDYHREQLFEQEVRPMIEELGENVSFQQRFGKVKDHWRETRLSVKDEESSYPEHEVHRNILNGIKAEYIAVDRGRGRTVRSMEYTWIMQHILANVYGFDKATLLQNITEFDDDAVERTLAMLGSWEQIRTSDWQYILGLEYEVLRAYNEQYRDFENRHRDELGRLSYSTSTFLTTKRAVYNDILNVMYGFDPRIRAYQMGRWSSDNREFDHPEVVRDMEDRIVDIAVEAHLNDRVQTTSVDMSGFDPSK